MATDAKKFHNSKILTNAKRIFLKPGPAGGWEDELLVLVGLPAVPFCCLSPPVDGGALTSYGALPRFVVIFSHIFLLRASINSLINWDNLCGGGGQLKVLKCVTGAGAPAAAEAVTAEAPSHPIPFNGCEEYCNKSRPLTYQLNRPNRTNLSNQLWHDLSIILSQRQATDTHTQFVCFVAGFSIWNEHTRIDVTLQLTSELSTYS